MRARGRPIGATGRRQGGDFAWPDGNLRLLPLLLLLFLLLLLLILLLLLLRLLLLLLPLLLSRSVQDRLWINSRSIQDWLEIDLILTLS